MFTASPPKVMGEQANEKGTTTRKLTGEGYVICAHKHFSDLSYSYSIDGYVPSDNTISLTHNSI